MAKRTKQYDAGEFTDVRGFAPDDYPSELRVDESPLIGFDEWGGWYYDDSRGYLEQYLREESIDQWEEKRTPMEPVDEPGALDITEIDFVEFLEGLDVLTDEGEKLLARNDES